MLVLVNNDAQDTSDGVAEGPASLGFVKLARKPGMLSYCAVYVGLYGVSSLSARGYPRYLVPLGQHLQYPDLHELVRCFLYDRIHEGTQVEGAATIPLDPLPSI